MTQHQWETIEQSLSGLSVADKLEVIERITRSIPARPVESPDIQAWRRDNLDRLRRELAAMPVGEVEDGLSNRDHDEILYGKRS